MRRFIFASNRWDTKLSLSEHVFCVQSYLARESDRCVRIDIEYFPEILEEGKPHFLTAYITAAAKQVDPFTLKVELSQAHRLSKSAEAKVMFDRFRVESESTVVLYRYHLENTGISIVHVADGYVWKPLAILGAVELSDEHLDNMDLAYAPLTVWAPTRRRRYLGS
jgi:CYTH domain-containing protein